MFSFFKKQPEKKSVSPVVKVFAGATLGQVYSVLNFILVISGGDDDINEEENHLMNVFRAMFAIDGKACLEYLHTRKRVGMIDDIKGLSAMQKDMLTLMVDDMLSIRPVRSKQMIDQVMSILEPSGVSREKFAYNITHVQEIMERAGR